MAEIAIALIVGFALGYGVRVDFPRTAPSGQTATFLYLRRVGAAPRLLGAVPRTFSVMNKQTHAAIV